jgi:hypothetical protein
MKSFDSEMADLEARSVPMQREINPERVQHYLTQLRQRIAERTDVQRVVLHELKRTHDFDVRVLPTGREFTLSLALPTDELLATDAIDKRLMSVLATPGEKPYRQIVREVSGSSDPAT